MALRVLTAKEWRKQWKWGIEDDIAAFFLGW